MGESYGSKATVAIVMFILFIVGILLVVGLANLPEVEPSLYGCNKRSELKNKSGGRYYGRFDDPNRVSTLRGILWASLILVILLFLGLAVYLLFPTGQQVYKQYVQPKFSPCGGNDYGNRDIKVTETVEIQE